MTEKNNVKKQFADELPERRQRMPRIEELEICLKQREAALVKSSRKLQLIRECNQALVRTTNEFLLLHDICRIMVKVGGYHRTWVGYAQQDEGKTIQPVAWVGYEGGFQGVTNITWADTEQGQSPAGRAIRGGAPCLIRQADTSEIALPLVSWNCLGVLSICGLAVDEVDDEEIQLLTELADTLAYAITILRIRAEHESSLSAGNK